MASSHARDSGTIRPMAPVEKAPRVKGIALRNAMSGIRDLCGPKVERAVLDTVRRELGEGLRYGSIVATGWYPVADHAALFRAACEETGGGLSLARRLGADAIARDLRGPYAIFARMLGPERMLAVSSRLFGQYYDTGRAEVLETRRGFAEVQWVECRGFGELVLANIVGAAEGMLTVLGAEHVRVRVVAGGGERDDFIRVTGHWQ